MIARIRAAGLAAALAAGVLVPAATGSVSPASAVTCWGDYCSGKDPEASGCSADAYTVVSARIPSTYAYVELRWSPTCKTNWARVGSGYASMNPGALRAIQCATGYTQSGVVGNNGTYGWTRMIYSPRYGVSARWLGAPGSTATSCA